MCGNAVSYCSLRERFPLKWMVYHKLWVVSSHAGTFDYEPRFWHIHLCDFCLRCRTMEANGISCVGITASHYKQNKKTATSLCNKVKKKFHSSALQASQIKFHSPSLYWSESSNLMDRCIKTVCMASENLFFFSFQFW